MSVLRMRKTGETVWNEMQDPISMQWSLSDLDGEDGSGRNQLGETFRDRIAQKRELSCSWGPLGEEEAAQLLSCLNDSFFEVEYPDALSGARKSGVFYTSSKQLPMYQYDADQGRWLWSGISATLTER